MRQRRDEMSLPACRVVSDDLLDRFNFPHLCDLYKPEPLGFVPGATPNPSGLQVGDSRYQLVSTDVSLFYSPTPETDQPTVMGRVREGGIFTLDKFVFPVGLEIHDVWAIVFLSAGDNYRDVFVVQGEPQSSNVHPFHRVRQQLVYGKRVGDRTPAGITVRDPLGLVPGV